MQWLAAAAPGKAVTASGVRTKIIGHSCGQNFRVRQREKTRVACKRVGWERALRPAAAHRRSDAAPGHRPGRPGRPQTIERIVEKTLYPDCNSG